MVSTPLKNISQLRLLFHIVWNIKHVPNHQPDRVYKPTHMSLGYLIYPDLDEKPPVPGGKNLQKIRRKGESQISEIQETWLGKGPPTDNFSNSLVFFYCKIGSFPFLREIWWWNCGWASEILHHLIDGKHPLIHRVSTFQPRWYRIFSIHRNL